MKIPHDKKFAICINSFNMGGAERVALTLINHFCAVFPVNLICLEKQDVYSVPDGIPVHYLSNMTGWENNLYKFFMLPVLAWRLKNLCRKNNIRLVQSHLSRANYVSLLAGMFGSVHQCHIVIHGIAGEYRKKGFKGMVNLLLMGKLYHRADRIFVNSQGVKSNLASYLGRGRRIEIIPNAFDIEEIQKKSGEPVNEKEFFYRTEITYIITAGRLTASKRQIDLLHAFKMVVESFEHCELLILGEGEEENNLHKYLEKNNLAKKVHMIGRVENPYKFLKRAHLFVSASESESFGNVIIEAMACRCPVVAADCPFGPREILAPASDPQKRLNDKIETTGYGILSPVHSPDLLFAAIKKMLTDDTYRKKCIEDALIRCRLYDVKKIGDSYTEFLEEDINDV